MQRSQNRSPASKVVRTDLASLMPASSSQAPSPWEHALGQSMLGAADREGPRSCAEGGIEAVPATWRMGAEDDAGH